MPQLNKFSFEKPELEKLQVVFKGMRIGQVLGNRVLVEPADATTKMDELEEKARRGEAGGLYMPERDKERNTPRASQGIVLAVGNGVSAKDEALLKDEYGNYKAVTFGQYSGGEWIFEERVLRILELREVVAILEPIESVDDGVLEQDERFRGGDTT